MRPIVLLASLLSMLLVLIACSRELAPAPVEHADRILILKSAHTLSLMKGDSILRTYRVALGRSPAGPKSRQGDHKTPEGQYIIDAKKEHSRFHRALHISYPSTADQERAQKGGYGPGGNVEIHGIENGLGWIGSLHSTEVLIGRMVVSP
jgi:murein L,D-transpeptidase YafK